MNIIKSPNSNFNKGILTFLVVMMLVFSLFLTGTADEDEEVQTPSKMAKIGYRNVGSVMSSVTGAEVDKKELVTEALNNLFNELADHLEDKGVSDHVLDNFRTKFDSASTMYEAGVINSQQLGSEASTLVENLGRRDKEGKVPSSVLKEAGMSNQDIEEVAENGKGKPNSDQMVRNLTREEEREKEKELKRERKGR